MKHLSILPLFSAASRFRFAHASVSIAAAAWAIGNVSPTFANDLMWNDGVGNFVTTDVWSYNNGGVLATTTNPFLHVSTTGGFAGENLAIMGNNADVTLNTVTVEPVSGKENRVYGIRVGTGFGGADLTSIGGPNLQGNGILRVTGATPLLVELNTSSPAVDGQFIAGGSSGVTSEVFWDSTGTLTVNDALRVGQNGGTGTFHQNAGTVIAGNSSSASSAYLGVGSRTGSNAAGNGTYNLNNGALQIGSGFDAATGQEVLRNLNIGHDNNSTGLFNLGDGIGAEDTAVIETWDNVVIGAGSGVGTLNIRSDGQFNIRYAAITGGLLLPGANAPLIINNGVVNHLGGQLDMDGQLLFGHNGVAAYQIVGKPGAINVRALEIGTNGTLGFTFDALGATTLTVEGDTNTSGDPVKGIELIGSATLALNGLSNYASNSTLTLVDSLDPSVSPDGQFINVMQGASVGTNSLGTTFYLNYFGGTGNDIVLQTTVPSSIATGLVWNVGAANFGAGWARGNGSFGVGAFPVDPFGAPTEDLFLGNNGVATLDNSTNQSSGIAVDSLRVGTDLAQARIAGKNGNGTLNVNGSVSLTVGNGATQVGDTGDLTVGSGGFAGTVTWNSTGTLTAEGKVRIGQGGTGTFTQTAGVVIAGNTGGTDKFMAIGQDAGSSGTYNLHGGALRPAGGLGVTTNPRELRVGAEGATGALTVGDGVSAAGTAVLESSDELFIGRNGGNGTLTIRQGGAITLDGTLTDGARLVVGEGPGGTVGTVIQTGGTVVAQDQVRIGGGPGATATYTISGGTLSTAGDADLGSFHLARNGASGKLRVEGTGSVTHGAEFYVTRGESTNANASVGRLELAGSAANFTIGQLENDNAAHSETIRWEADAGGITPIEITGAGPAGNITAKTRALLQDPLEAAANTGSGATLMGNGIALELNLSLYTSTTSLTLIDNQTIDDPIIGFFERGSTLDLYEEGALISGTGYGGTVSISYVGGTGNDVVLNLTAGGADDADFDADGDVDGADFLTWQRGLGITGTATLQQGDANNDDNVTGADLQIWKNQFGVPAVAAAGAVPEPGALALTLAAATLATTFIRRRGAQR